MPEKVSRCAAAGEIMFVIKMFGAIKDLCRFFAACQLFIGKQPSSVSSPSIIFFPVLPSQLNCGFAGLMTLQLTGENANLTADLTLTQLWGKIKNSGLQNVLTGEIAAESCFGGLETLNFMEKATPVSYTHLTLPTKR